MNELPPVPVSTLPFGAILSALRRSRGLSREQLARASGVSAHTIKALEMARRSDPSWSTVQLLALALGCDPGIMRTLTPSLPAPGDAEATPEKETLSA